MTATATQIDLTVTERTALDAFMKASRKWYTAKRIAAITGLNPKAVEKAFARFVSLDLMWRSEFQASRSDNRYAMSDEGVEFHESLPKVKASKPKASKPQPKAEKARKASESVEQENVTRIIAEQELAEKALTAARKALKRAEKAAKAAHQAAA